ncbi:MAG: hypothetical protein HY257_06685 [Chloroflexi bacterium]|nr:hypothetical protein [Chloroflexota bacterium]
MRERIQRYQRRRRAPNRRKYFDWRTNHNQGLNQHWPDTVSANVSTGFSTLVEFGDQLFTPTPTATSTNTATPTATPTNTPTLTRTPTIVPSPTPVCLTLVRTSSNVSSPKGIALDQANSRVYVANFNSSAVTVLNENTGAILNTFLTGGVHSNAVAYLASLNRLYVSDRDNSSVSVLDATSGAQIAQIAVGDLPFGIAANAHNNRVYVANFSSGTVSVIDANVNTVTATIFVGANPTFIAIDPNTDNAYVVVRGANAVKVINLANNIIATISIATDGFGIAINPFTQRAYVSVQSNNTLAVINTQTNAIVGTINVPAQGFNLAVNTNGNAIYVNIPALARIYKIDGASNLISGFAATSLGADEGIAVNSATNRVYVSNFFANSVTVYTDSCAPAPTPSLTPTATNTPLPFGNICVTAYNDLNANGSRDLGEPVLAGATITIAPFGGSVIGTRVTDGSEPFCFTNLAPGLFVVTETDPLGATSTSPNLIAAIVASGISTLVDFGDQFPATNTPTPTFTATPSATPTSTPTVDPNTASICVSPFVDFNSNGILDAGEPPAIGAIISIAPIGGSTIDSWASDGNNPHCFLNLAQGLYFVTEIDPPGFASTSPNQVAVFAAIGFTTSVEFGDTGGAATLTPTATPSRTPTPLAPATLPVSQIFPNDPKGMVLDSARGRLFVISHLDNSVIVANENNLTPIKKIAVRTLPFGIGMINDKVYVANFGNGSDPSSVSVLNPATLTKSLDISLASCGGEATHLAVNPNNGFVYIALHGSARVAVINSATDALIGCVTVNAGTFGLAVHNASNKVFVGNRDGLDLWRVNSAGTIFTASRVKSFSNGQGGGAVFYVGVSNAFNKLFALVGLPSSDVPNQLYVYDIDSFGNLNNEQIISVGNTDDGGFVMQSQVCGTIYIAETADSSVRVLDSNLNFKTTFGSAQGIGIGPYGLLENPNLLRIYITNKISNTFTVLNECPGPEGPSSAPAPTLTRTPTRTPTRVSTLALAPSATRTLATIPTRFPTRTPTAHANAEIEKNKSQENKWHTAYAKSVDKPRNTQRVIARSSFCDEAIPKLQGDCFAPLAMT